MRFRYEDSFRALLWDASDVEEEGDFNIVQFRRASGPEVCKRGGGKSEWRWDCERNIRTGILWVISVGNVERWNYTSVAMEFDVSTVRRVLDPRRYGFIIVKRVLLIFVSVVFCKSEREEL